MPNGESDYQVEAAEWSEREIRDYRAAGLIPVKWNEEKTRIELLLPLEYRTGEGTRWHVFGGLRAPREQLPLHTAVREFWEETGEILCEKDILQLFKETEMYGMWFAAGVYCLHFVPVRGELATLLQDIPERYQMIHTNEMEATAVDWVPSDILEPCVTEHFHETSSMLEALKISSTFQQLRALVEQNVKSDANQK